MSKPYKHKVIVEPRKAYTFTDWDISQFVSTLPTERLQLIAFAQLLQFREWLTTESANQNESDSYSPTQGQQWK